MQLSLPHVGLLPATVSSVEAGAIVLVLAVKDNRVQRLAGQEVAVEHKTGRGIQRYGGILQIDSGDTLRVIMQGEAERIQRRDGPVSTPCSRSPSRASTSRSAVRRRR